MTPREALDRITALCDNADRLRHDSISTAAVRAVLAEVSPEPGGVLDRDQARDVIATYLYVSSDSAFMRQILDALAGCVRPAAIDRDALRRTLQHYDARFALTAAPGEVLDAILALVRPVAGVTLTPEEAKRAAHWYEALSNRSVPTDEDDALAARLEATS